MRYLVTAVALGVVGLLGFGSCIALQSWSGQSILSQLVPAATRSAAASTRPARRPVRHDLDVHLDASMRPIVGTLRLDGGGGARLRVVDPAGRTMHEARYGNPFAGSTARLAPIEPDASGTFRLELEVDPGVDATLELRRNGIVVSNTWPFASVAVAMVGLLIACGRLAIGLHRRALRRMAVLRDAAAAERP